MSNTNNPSNSNNNNGVEPIELPSDAELKKLKKEELKIELRRRGVIFLSKQRKAELFDLLKRSINLPIVNHDAVPMEAKEPAWNEYHPARKLLYDEITGGRITDGMNPAAVYYLYRDTLEFRIRGMEYGPVFKRRFLDLREQINSSKSRAARDTNALKKAMRNHPAPQLNHKGRPQWNGGVAQVLLKMDMTLGRHLTQTPAKLYESRPEYKRALSPNSFRWKIKQVVGTHKYLHTLEHDAEAKLRKNLKKIR